MATEALSGLGVEDRKAQGLQGGVRSLVFIAAFLLGKDMTLKGSSSVERLGWCAYEASEPCGIYRMVNMNKKMSLTPLSK